MKIKRNVITGIIAAFPLFLLILWGYCHIECYCAFWPGVDTQYASGFSESAFDSVVSGMTAKDVQQKLGAPLWSETNGDGAIRWCYTDDGKCVVGGWKLADFAWLGREITFADGKVIKILKHVYYD